jgi:hypothetical protein
MMAILAETCSELLKLISFVGRVVHEAVKERR